MESFFMVIFGAWLSLELICSFLYIPKETAAATNTIMLSILNFFITFSLFSLSPVVPSEPFRPSAVGRNLSVTYDPPGVAFQKVICIFKPAISGQVISHFFHMGCSYIGSVGIARHTGDQIILQQYPCALSDSAAKSAQNASFIHLCITP